VADLPAYFSDTPATILARLLAGVRRFGYDPAEGSYPYQQLATMAQLFYDTVVLQGLATVDRIFLDTALPDDLPKQGVDFGTPQLAATFAAAALTFTGVNDTVIPAGTRFSTAATASQPGQTFATDVDATIAGGFAAGVPATAVTSGAAGNVGPGTIIFTVGTPIAGVTGVTNPAAAVGGSDEETTDAYRARLILAAARDPGPDNMDHYRDAILKLPGVGAVTIDPIWNGPDTIRVIVLNDDLQPDGALATAIQALVDPTANPGKGYGVAAEGDVVTVVTATPATANLTIPSLLLDAGQVISAVEALILSGLEAYFAALLPGDDVLLQDVQAVIAVTSGVRDFGDVLINGSHASLAISSTQLAQLGSIVYSPAPTIYGGP
jgi:uncharacterized phage protein gp47/JayE